MSKYLFRQSSTETDEQKRRYEKLTKEKEKRNHKKRKIQNKHEI